MPFLAAHPAKIFGKFNRILSSSFIKILFILNQILNSITRVIYLFVYIFYYFLLLKGSFL